jgi:membrane associated rhomboid family serine protease
VLSLDPPGFVDDPRFGGYALDPKNFRLYQLFTSQFLHVGFFHLLGNMVFLVVFARYVEDRLGWWRFLVVYFACAVVGDLAYLATGPGLPAVGASGAISGLMGWVRVAKPGLEMNVMLMFGALWTRPVKLACAWLLVPWILWEVLGGWLTGSTGGVAVAAHVGGFACGALAAAWMRSRWAKGTTWYLEPPPSMGGEAVVQRLHEARGRPRLVR